jgi:hypothetical protein
MPRAPRPRTLKHAASRRSDLALVPSVALAVPPPPSDLSARYVAQWEAFWSSPLVRVIVPELDIDGIETLFRLRDERDRAFRAGRRKRFIRGSHGQPVINPLLQYAQSLQKDVRAAEDRLAGSPKSRMTLGVLFGDMTRSLDDLNGDLDESDDLGDLLDDVDVLDGIG